MVKIMLVLKIYSVVLILGGWVDAPPKKIVGLKLGWVVVSKIASHGNSGG